LLDRQRAVYGDFHPQTLLSMDALARSLSFAGRFDEAEGLLRAAAQVAEGKTGKASKLSVAFADSIRNLQQFKSALATNPTFRVEAVEGLASYRLPDENWIPLERGLNLPGDAEVRTGPRALIKLAIGGQTITVDRLSIVKLSSLLERKGKVQVQYGRVRYDLEAGQAERNLTIMAPSSTLAVRG
jgi:hypothetical protein